MLRDRLVCGVNHETSMNHLFLERKLDFGKALELAQSIESAEQYTSLKAAQVTSTQVHRSNIQKSRNKQKSNEQSKQSRQGVLQYVTGVADCI